jgi:hypothetical protein
MRWNDLNRVIDVWTLSSLKVIDGLSLVSLWVSLYRADIKTPINDYETLLAQYHGM